MEGTFGDFNSDSKYAERSYDCLDSKCDQMKCEVDLIFRCCEVRLQ